MVSDKLSKYSNMMPTEIKMLFNGVPKDDLEWVLIMYLFENTRSGNVITLGKLSSFFDIDENVLSERLDKMSTLWIRQYLNSSENSKIYRTYEITEIASDFMVKIVELLDIMLKDKGCNWEI